jgi:hypothetical protein
MGAKEEATTKKHERRDRHPPGAPRGPFPSQATRCSRFSRFSWLQSRLAASRALPARAALAKAGPTGLETAMSPLVIIIGFLVVIGGLNIFEFGRLD